jgi:elongation factor P--(R)-beta-lysine ligase
MDTRAIETRSRLKTGIRDFFLSRGYLELDTPLLAPTLIPESCLEVFRTEYIDPFRGTEELYLVPSPEVWMKPVIALTGRSVFQLSRCFRNCEAKGRTHSPEFTMLEYYTVGGTAASSIPLTEELFKAILPPEAPLALRPPFRSMTMEEAWKTFAALDLATLQDEGAMAEAARGKGLMVAEAAAWEDAFNQIFLSFVEPALPADRPLVLDRFPARIECLAADIPGTPWKERWELYAAGMEIANTYTEAGSAEAVRASFERETARKRAHSRVVHRVDMDYPRVFDSFPLCSGVALGFDRLLMAVLGERDISSLRGA